MTQPSKTNIVDEAEWIARNFDLTRPMVELTKATGFRASEIRTRTRLLALSPEMINAARDGTLNIKQIEAITQALKPATRERLFKRFINEQEQTP